MTVKAKKKAKKKRKKKKPAIPTVTDRNKIKTYIKRIKEARAEIKFSEKARDEIVKKYVDRLKKDWKLPPRRVGDYTHDQHDNAKWFVETLLGEAEKALRAGLTRIKITWKRRSHGYSSLGSYTIRQAQEKKGKKAEITERNYHVQTSSYHVDRWGSRDEWDVFYDVTINIEL